jgi:hypothetical protein
VRVDLVARIHHFVSATAPGGTGSPDGTGTPDGTGAPGFDALALAVARHQLEQVEPYRRFAASRGVTAGSLRDWRDAPPLPTSAFKLAPFASSPAAIIFRSSGTTQGERRSEHHQAHPELYRQIVSASFPHWCLTPELRAAPAVLSLVPPRAVVPDSSLGFMVDHLLDQLTAPASAARCVAANERGIDTASASAWLEERARERTPVLILATALALFALLESLRDARRRLALAPGSVIFETGGFKGRKRQVTRPELVAACAELLGVPPQRVVREYGMTELTSQAYSEVLRGGDPDRFVTPPWLRVRIVEPLSLREVAPGTEGLIAAFDLGNAGSVAHVLTEDLGVADERGGFQLLGRAAGAALRGCSLAIEELAGS